MAHNPFHQIFIDHLCIDINFFISSKFLSLKYSSTISLFNLSIFFPYIFSNKSYHISSSPIGFHVIPYNPATAYNFLHPISIAFLCHCVNFFSSSKFLPLKYSWIISLLNLFISTPYIFSNKSYHRS